MTKTAAVAAAADEYRRSAGYGYGAELAICIGHVLDFLPLHLHITTLGKFIIVVVVVSTSSFNSFINAVVTTTIRLRLNRDSTAV